MHSGRDGRPAALPEVQEGALRALGMLCASTEANRRQLVDCRVLPQLAGALAEEGSAQLRAAACLCMRSLSRSTNLLGWVHRAFPSALAVMFCRFRSVNVSPMVSSRMWVPSPVHAIHYLLCCTMRSGPASVFIRSIL
jgi:hypothetical protein